MRVMGQLVAKEPTDETTLEFHSFEEEESVLRFSVRVIFALST
jgi:hypothetical protein